MRDYGLSLASLRLQSPDYTEIADATAATGYGFASTAPNSYGYTETDFFGSCGNIVVIQHVFTKGAAGGPAVALR